MTTFPADSPLNNKKIKNPKGQHKRRLMCCHCSKPFVRWGPVATKSYCSRECYSANRKGESNPNWRGGDVARVCKYCKKDFIATQAQIRKNNGNGARYCSQKCGAHGRAKMTKIEYRLKNAMGKRVRDCLTASGKSRRRWVDLVGFTAEELKTHIEAQFRDGMSWENYGKAGWHIDHIIPISAFKITSFGDEAFKQCWALSNLQPLWATDNYKKGGAYNRRRKNNCAGN